MRVLKLAQSVNHHPIKKYRGNTHIVFCSGALWIGVIVEIRVNFNIFSYL